MIFINPIVDILLIAGLVPAITTLAGFFIKRREISRYLGLIGFAGYIILIIYLLQPDVWNTNLNLYLSDVLGSSKLSLNGFSRFFIIVFSLIALPSFLESVNYMEKDRNLGLQWQMIYSHSLYFGRQWP